VYVHLNTVQSAFLLGWRVFGQDHRKIHQSNELHLNPILKWIRFVELSFNSANL
jgi:hypothetical protein